MTTPSFPAGASMTIISSLNSFCKSASKLAPRAARAEFAATSPAVCRVLSPKVPPTEETTEALPPPPYAFE
jgi:hypothetical protein